MRRTPGSKRCPLRTGVRKYCFPSFDPLGINA